MKRILLSHVALALWLGPAAVMAGEIDLSIGGFTNDAGLARIVLMKDKAGHQGQIAPQRVASVPIRNKQARWLAKDVPPGSYSIIAHHDTDSNDQLNRPVFSLPTEPYGFSKGAWTSLGIPTWSDVAFTVGNGRVRQAIQLRMNAFSVFGQLAVIGGVSLLVISGLLFLSRRIQRRRSLDSRHSN